ncbi:ArgE/DapE family deacylase [Deinococcus sp. QL22]|uniref:ArgE/DapE family deacylase n=1 Tax=Deinococcus sp. QL22 TaxID=2939437 RepID=UPI0020170F07|nr:ArgE/DapE family deacylase [Deinococcus sp. QL22]UQN08368.1 ArgE/DapE family deacylase [Deinococcus sp. QL22]
MKTLTTLLADLVGLDSINPDLVPDGAGEAPIARYVSDWAGAQGLEAHWVEPVDGRPSVVVVARGSGGGRSLMLNGHLDTVGVAGMTDPFSARIEHGQLFGRGAYDMKGGLAACLWVAAQAKQLSLRGDVIVACVADEEAASLGMQAVLEHWHADAAIVTEPTGLDVCVAHKGFVWVEVKVQGRAAHGSRPDLGVDAIAKAGPVLMGVEALDRHLRAGPGHPLLGTGSVHLSLIRGGQEMSSYPDSCFVGLERRTVPGETPESAEAEVEALLNEARQRDPAFRASHRVTLVRSAFEVPPETEVVRLVRRYAGQITGAERRVYGETFWMDAAFLGAAGIPTVVFGAGGGGAHATEEWADLTSVQQCADVLLAVAGEFCA